MIEIPRIAAFRPLDRYTQVVTECFPREQYSIRIVSECSEILKLTEDEGSAFDAIILTTGAALLDETFSVIKKTKSEITLQTVPLLVLAFDLTSEDIEPLYRVGADFVYTTPFDPIQLHFQISALNRLHQFALLERDRAVESTGLRLSTMRALNLAREGIVLFDTKLKPIFISTSAGRLLSIDWETEQSDVDRTINYLTPLVEEHIRASQATNMGTISELPLSILKMPLIRADKRSFEASLKILTITGVNIEPVGYAMSISDLTEFDSLNELFQLYQRTRGLSVLSSATLIKLANDSGISCSPSSLFQVANDSSKLGVSLSHTIAIALEYLDLILHTDTVININQSVDFTIALNSSDLVQLISFLILEASDHAGAKGEISIQLLDKDADTIVLRIDSISSRSVPFAQADDFTSLLQSSSALSDSIKTKIGTGWGTSRNVALQLGIQLRRDIVDSFSQTVEVDLPRR